MTVSTGNVIPSKKIIFPLSVATGSTRPKNREQSFEINSFRIIYAQKSITIFRNQFFSNNLWDVSTRGDRKREYYFLEGMTFPVETVISRQLTQIQPQRAKRSVSGAEAVKLQTRASSPDAGGSTKGLGPLHAA